MSFRAGSGGYRVCPGDWGYREAVSGSRLDRLSLVPCSLSPLLRVSVGFPLQVVHEKFIVSGVSYQW